ncbi:MAG: hypothetical protein ACKO37_05875 [Vampirovibrionales bacterium]
MMTLITHTLDKARRFLTSPEMVEFYQKPGFSKWAVTGFILANMATWPPIILMDKKTPKHEREYAAERQFFQEVLGLGCHLTIANSFERLAHWVTAKAFPKEMWVNNPRQLGAKLNMGDWKTFRHALDTLNPEVTKQVASGHHAAKALMIETPQVLKGGIRAGSILAYALTFEVVAPYINNLYLPVFLRGANKALEKISGGKLHLPTNEDRAKHTTPMANPKVLNVVSSSHVPSPHTVQILPKAIPTWTPAMGTSTLRTPTSLPMSS